MLEARALVKRHGSVGAVDQVTFSERVFTEDPHAVAGRSVDATVSRD